MISSTSDQLIDAVFEFGRQMHRRCAEKKDGNWLRMRALGLIAENDGMTMTAFAEALDVTSPSATSFAGKLVDLGWVARRADRKNRKLVRLHLTQAGAVALQEQMLAHREMIRSIHAAISPEDQLQLLRILRQMISATRSAS